MTLHFEMMLNNNVLFGSLNEVVEFINHVQKESFERRFNDRDWLDRQISPEECFAKIILSCGYRWLPDEKEMDIIWKIINNLSPIDINRVYYKNNLFSFMDNSRIFGLLNKILVDLDNPLLNSFEIPDNVLPNMKLLEDLIFEYVYYHYQYIDRIDRCDNMIKAITMVSDTDSTIISLDGWYRYVAEKIKGQNLKIANDTDIAEEPKDLEAKRFDYDFAKDEIIEITYREEDMTKRSASKNVRFTIINIMAHILDRTVNDYMERMCTNQYSLMPKYHDKCRIYAKTEFLFSRLMMTTGKKHYSSFMEVQEGHLVPEEKGFDVKGIDILAKSTTPKATRDALSKIVIEDILKTPVIDQVKFIKDIAIFEKQIINSVRSGDRQFFKPATIKSMRAYEDPMRIQGVKASVAWNIIHTNDYPAIDLDERNAIDIIKVNITRSTIDRIKDTYPEAYNNMVKALDDETFKTYSSKPDPKTGEKKLLKNEITSIALPLDVQLPLWLEEFIDYDTIIANNLNGFPYESIGLKRLSKKNIGCTNIIEI